MEVVEFDFAGHRTYGVKEWLDDGLVHGFLGRSFNTKSDLENWPKILPQTDLALLDQVAGARILDDLQFTYSGKLPEADGWICKVGALEERIALGIKTADCVPVIIYAPSIEYASIVHCGWRGAVAEIMVKACSRMINNGASAEEIELCFGPGAGVCCYEVGEPVLAEMKKSISRFGSQEKNGRSIIVERDGKSFVDIKALLLHQALCLGVPIENITDISRCTICDKDYFSHRREKESSGRQLSFVANFFR